MTGRHTKKQLSTHEEHSLQFSSLGRSHTASLRLWPISLLSSNPLPSRLEPSPARFPLLHLLDYRDPCSSCHTPLMSQIESSRDEQGSRLSLSLLCPFGLCELDHWLPTRCHPQWLVPCSWLLFLLSLETIYIPGHPACGTDISGGNKLTCFCVFFLRIIFAFSNRI